ncbi:MAG: S1 family peptidase, partial [Planctomycetales bacterium]|nr:S1 family peptidase [Planctomycetales bacterium]
MSLLQMSKNRKVGSTWGRIRDSFFHAERRRHGERKNRRLRIDQLEERTLLSVSPVNPYDVLVNQAIITAQTTLPAQSVAVDHDGDFVAVWSRVDPVLDVNGNPVIDPLTGGAMTDENVYARYFTDEVQRIVLPEGVLDNAPGNQQYARFSFLYGGNEVQKLTISTVTPSLGNAPAQVVGTFSLWLDVNGDGVQDLGEVTAAINFNETAFNSGDPATDPALLIQAALRDLAAVSPDSAALADAVVVGINSQEYLINFGDASGGQDQPQLNVVAPAFVRGFLPAVQTSTVRDPVQIGVTAIGDPNIAISPTTPALTATAIEQAFIQTTQNFYYGPIFQGEMPADLFGPSVMRTAVPKVSVVSVKTADDPLGLRTFDITFIGDAGKKDHPPLVIEAGSVLDENGTALTTEDILAATMKEPTAEFRVNPEEPDNPFTPLPDKFAQTAPAVAMDADGSFIIVWQGQVPDGENYGTVTDVFARRFQPVGIVDPGDPVLGLSIWKADMNYDGVVDDLDPQIQGVRPVETPIPYTFLVPDAYQVPGDVYTFRVNTITANAQGNPHAAMDSKGNFAISWSDSGQPISFFNNIMARRFSHDGTPLEAVEVRVNAVDTDVHDNSFVAMSEDGHTLVTWEHNIMGTPVVDAKLYDADGRIARDQFRVVAGANGPTAAFNEINDYVIQWTQLRDIDNLITNGLLRSGIYLRQWSINGTTIRNPDGSDVRVNSASLNPDTNTTWPYIQTNGQVVLDADGDLTVIYQGFGPDVAQNATSGRATALLQAILRLPENADLIAAWPYLGSPMFRLPVPPPFMGPGGNTGGDTDGVIEEALILASNAGFTDEQLGRFNAIMNGIVGLVRGEANGIMYSQFDADPRIHPNALSSDNIVNALRDGNNQRVIIALFRGITDGDFDVLIVNGTTGQQEVVTIEPAYLFGVIEPIGTIQRIDNALEEAVDEVGINWPEPMFEGPIDVRLMGEINDRAGTYWDVGGAGAPWYFYEVTFQGEVHDTPMRLVLMGSSLMVDDVPAPPPVIFPHTGASAGTPQYNASIGMTPDGDFTIVWTQTELNSMGRGTNQNIYYRRFDEGTDTAGPTVAGIYAPSGQLIDDNTTVYSANGLRHIVVSLTEAMYDNAAHTGDAVTNPANYRLLLNGVEVTNAVVKVEYGMNRAADLARTAEYADLNPLPVNRWEIIVTVDANGLLPGTPTMGTGNYTLELLTPVTPTPTNPIGRNGLRDKSGNPLGHTGFQVGGANATVNFTVVVVGQTPGAGIEFLVNDTTAGVQTTGAAYSVAPGQQFNYRTVAVDHDGDFVVVWVGYGQDGDTNPTLPGGGVNPNFDPSAATNAGVYMQMFDRNNNPLTSETSVNTYTKGNQLDCAVAIDADGDFVVVWAGQGQDADGSWGIFGQRFDSMGRKLGGEFQVNTTTIGDQVAPGVAMDSYGNFVVTWARRGQLGSDYFNEIWAQVFDSEGVKTSSEFRVSAWNVEDPDEARPVVAVSDVGTFVVVWSYVSNRINGVVTDTFLAARLFDMTGTPLTAVFQPNTTTGGANDPLVRSARNAQVAMERDGFFIVVWEAYDDNFGDYDIRYRLYDHDGTARTGEAQANIEPPANALTYIYYAGDQLNPSVAVDADGDFVITWNGNGAETNPVNSSDFLSLANADTQGVWFRKFNPHGGNSSTQLRANLTQCGYQGLASVGMTTAGDFVVAWGGNGYGDNQGVYAVRMDEPSDTAGPMVTDFLLPDGTPVAVSGQITQPLYAVVVSFDEELLDNVAHTGDAATNPANYALLIDDVEIVGGISQVFYGLDEAYELSPEYGLSAQQTNKYQAVLVVDANGAAGGVEALTNGRYRIVVKNSLRDKAGNPLLSTGQDPNGFTISGVIHVTVPTGQETCVSDGQNQVPPQGQHTYATTADAVAADADGDYVVAWTDATSGRQGVWIKMYEQTATLETDGTRTTSVVAGNEIRVSSDATASDISVARDIDGDFVVTWSAWNATTSWDVYAQRFDAAGRTAGSVFLVNSHTADVQRYSAVAMDADGDFVVAWQSLDQDGSGYGIYAKRYSNTGAVVNGSDETQQIIFSGGFTGAFRLRWDDDGNQATPDKVTAVISYSGNAFAIADDVENALKAIGANVVVRAVSVTELAIRFTDAASGSDQQPLWISPADVTKTGGGADAQVTTRTVGDGQSGEFLVNDTVLGNQMFPDVAMDAEGDFVITWTSSGQDGDAPTETNVYAKQFVGNYAYWTAESSAAASGSGNSGNVLDRTQAKVVTVDDPANHVVAAGAGFDGVVQVVTTTGSAGSGVLLAGTSYILTAAHVVWWDVMGMPLPSNSVGVFFDTPAGRVLVVASQVIVHPGYTGDVTGGSDLALIRLDAVPAGVTGFELYDGDPSGKVYSMYGYGMIGTGAAGATQPSGNVKLTGQNRFEATGNLLGYSDTLLVSDFDSGLAANDALGIVYGISNLGLGVNEACHAGGDSGGPLLIDGKIAAIVSFGFEVPGAWNTAPGLNSSFGEFNLDTKVSAYAHWIDNVTTGSRPEFLVNRNDVLAVNAAGNPTLRIDNQTGVQAHSSVAMDADGDFVVVWTSYNQDGVGSGYGPGFNGLNGVFARRYTADGAEASNAFQVNQVAEGNQQNARVAMDADGDFMVAWESFQDGSPAADYGIYARRYAATAKVNYQTNVFANAPLALVGTNPLLGLNGEMGGEFPVNTTKNGDQRFPGVALNDTGDAVIVWSGKGEVPGQEDAQGVFFQRFAQRRDNAGPTVGDVLNVGSQNGTVTLNRVLDGTDIGSVATRFVVTFGENVSTASGASGAQSVLNPANWQVTKDGRVLAGAVAAVQYGLNMAYQLGLASAPSNKYEAVVTFDGDAAAAGNQALGIGAYVLTVKDKVEDLFGNKLDGDYNGAAGANFSRTFTVLGGGTGGGPDGPGGPGVITPPGNPGPGATDPIVNTTTAGRQDSPAVAADAEGNYVVVWVSYDAVGSGDILAQMFDKTGGAKGLEFTVNSFTTGSQIDPDVAMDRYGNFVVVWSGQGADDQSGVFARVYDKYGQTVVTDFLVNQYTQNVQDMPAVAMDADGDFVVTWTSYSQDGDLDGIYARRFNLQGVTFGGEFLVNTTTANRQEDSDIAVDANGNFVIVWAGDQQDGNSWGVFGQRFSASGAKLGGEFRVNTYTLDKQFDPAVAMDADGDFVVVWSSFGQDLKDSYGVYARRYNTAGAAKDVAEFRVNQTTLNYQWTPDVGMAAGGDFVVTWSSLQDLADPNSTVKSYGIYARMFNADGSDFRTPTNNAVLGEFRVNATMAGQQVTPAIGVSSAGRFTVAWAGPDGNDMGIFARVIDPAAQSSTPAAQGPTVSRVVVAEAQGVRDNVFTSAEPLVLTWNADDPDGVAGAVVTIDGKSAMRYYGPYAASSGVNYAAAVGNLSAGSHTYVITATDNLGNSSQFIGTFNVVASATGTGPTISRVAVSQAKGFMSWNTLDPDGVASASIVIDGVNYNGNPSPESPSSVNFWKLIGNLSAGPHNYTITAVDKAGNSSQLTGSFTLTGGSTTGTGPVISRVAVSQALGFMSWNTLDADGVAGSSIVIDGVSYTGNGPYADASGVNFSVPITG